LESLIEHKKKLEEKLLETKVYDDEIKYINKIKEKLEFRLRKII